MFLFRSFVFVQSKLCPTLFDPTDCSTPGFPVLHYLLEFAQTHVHWVGDANNHRILCHPLLLPPSIFSPHQVVISNESALCTMYWPKYWSFSISPSSEYSGLTSFRIDCLISLLPKGLSRVFSNTTAQKHQFFSTQTSLWSNFHIYTWLLGKKKSFDYTHLC